jgi:hypothetical protein
MSLKAVREQASSQDDDRASQRKTQGLQSLEQVRAVLENGQPYFLRKLIGEAMKCESRDEANDVLALGDLCKAVRRVQRGIGKLIEPPCESDVTSPARSMQLTVAAVAPALRSSARRTIPRVLRRAWAICRRERS